MNNEARDKAIREIQLEWELGYTVEGPLAIAYQAGYQAARDESIRILKAKQEHDYE